MNTMEAIRRQLTRACAKTLENTIERECYVEALRLAYQYDKTQSLLMVLQRCYMDAVKDGSVKKDVAYANIITLIRQEQLNDIG